jgi:hypothetical protein
MPLHRQCTSAAQVPHLARPASLDSCPPLQVLSVVAQQLLSIQNALKAGLEVRTTNLSLSTKRHGKVA